MSVIDPLPLMIQYLDGKKPLTNDEREVLLFALYAESRDRGGLADRAIRAWARARGVGSVPQPSPPTQPAGEKFKKGG